MPYTTDRQIIERLIIPAVLRTIITIMSNDLGDDLPALPAVAAQLETAMGEAVAGMPANRTGKLVRRAQRATTVAMQAIADRVVGIQYLAIAQLAVGLTQQDYLLVGPESAFALAWHGMSDVMAVAADTVDGAEVDQAAADLAAALRGQGFFGGAWLPLAEAG